MPLIVNLVAERSEECWVELISPASCAWPFWAWLEAAHADSSARPASELHRSSCRGVAASLASSSFDQLWIGNSLAIRRGEQRVDSIAFFRIAPVVAPREFVQVAVNVLRANPVVDTEDLPLKVRPRPFQPIDVAKVVADVLAEA